MLGLPSKILFEIVFLGVLMQSRSLPLYLETQNMLENGASLFNQAYLYCDNFDSTETGWNAVGSAPYLNDDSTSYIQSFRMSNESWFGFSDATDLPQQIFLEVETQGGEPASYCTIFLGEGTASCVVATVCFDRFTSWKSYNVTSQLNSVEKLQAAKVKLQSLNATTSFGSRIYRCRLRLYTGPVPTYSTLGTNTREANASASFHCQWTDIDGLSTASLTHNCTGSFATANTSITDGWGNFSVRLPTNSLNNVLYWFWANDSLNSWERTENCTLNLVWSNYNASNCNYVDSLSTNGTQANAFKHTLGRKSFAAAGLFWVNYGEFNGTHYNEAYSYSSDGLSWTRGGLLWADFTEGGLNGGEKPSGGLFYWDWEYRANSYYVHMIYSSELANRTCWYRMGTLNQNGTITYSVPWQAIINCTNNVAVCPEGMHVGVNGEVWIHYQIKLGIGLDWTSTNITYCKTGNGTWITEAGYPKQVSNTTQIFGSALTVEAEVFSWQSNYAKVILFITHQRIIEVDIDNNVVQPYVNVTQQTMYEVRQFNIAEDVNNNLHMIYQNETGYINYGYRNATSALWSIIDYPIGYRSTAAFPNIGVHNTIFEVYVNWIDAGSVYLKARNGTTGSWSGLQRILVLNQQQEFDDSNVIMENIEADAVFHFAVYDWTSGTQEVWSIAYNAARSSDHLIGDINNDGMVDVFDCVRVALAFGSHPSDSNWDSQSDVSEDSVIDIFDIVIVAVHFGETS